uniref:Uncharacterized protein n=1 Tax=Tanacetum cinerariifolium TaxID=118510 RepID=A0A6L2N3E5_TANCI|nr:hypothetical protein [Tanacetum cinerariifolium]
MATMAENVIVAGFETRPPMLEKDSVINGPYKFKSKITAKDTYGIFDIRREDRLEDLKGDDKLLYDSEIKTVNILLLGLPVDINTLINDYQIAKNMGSRQRTYERHIDDQARTSSLSWPRPDAVTISLTPSLDGSRQHRFMPATPSPRFENNISLWIWCRPVISSVSSPNEPKSHDPIASLNKAMIFLSSVYRSKFPLTNNQFRTSSNPRTQTIAQNGQVMVQNVQGRQSQGYVGNAGNNQASGAQVDHIDAYDSECDDKATTNAIFMENLSPVCSLNDDTVAPYYDSDTLFEVPCYDTYHDSKMLNSNIQELGYIENIVSTNESYDEPKGNNDVISYTDYMLTIRDDAYNYVPPPIEKNDMMLFVIKQMKSQVENCNKNRLELILEMLNGLDNVDLRLSEAKNMVLMGF